MMIRQHKTTKYHKNNFECRFICNNCGTQSRFYNDENGMNMWKKLHFKTNPDCKEHYNKCKKLEFDEDDKNQEDVKYVHQCIQEMWETNPEELINLLKEAKKTNTSLTLIKKL